jgi:hypothetical protein
VGDEVDKGGKHQDDKPGGPGMKLAPVAVMVERQECQDEQVEGGRRRTRIPFAGRMKYASAAMWVIASSVIRVRANSIRITRSVRTTKPTLPPGMSCTSSLVPRFGKMS